MSLRGYRDRPYPLGTPEWESFQNFATAYYKDVIKIAGEVSGKLSPPFGEKLWIEILRVVLSPLVYLWEKWQLMSLDDKLKYAAPEYKKELEKIKAESQKVKDKVKEEKWANDTK